MRISDCLDVREEEFALVVCDGIKKPWSVPEVYVLWGV
jgi:hypothetical protein